jgi:predicted Zn-dependent peptidase
LFIVLRRVYYVNQCETINLHYSDTGLFALNFTGDSAHSREILELMIQTFENFRKPIDQVELNRAKNILKRNILQNMSNQGDRIEELAKSVINILYNKFLFISSTLSIPLPLINMLI